jgi:hypothetical protein
MKLALPFASPILIARASSAMAQSSESAKKEGMDLATRWEAPVNNRTSADAPAKTIADFFTGDAVLNLSTSPIVGKAGVEKFYSTVIEKNDPAEVAPMCKRLEIRPGATAPLSKNSMASQSTFSGARRTRARNDGEDHPSNIGPARWSRASSSPRYSINRSKSMSKL